MKCTLMHRRVEVAELELDETTGYILKIANVMEPEHLPVGVSFRKGIADRAALNAWWEDRSIPASRSGIRGALEQLELPNTKALLVRCFGLGLSDQYWIRPQNSKLDWDHINFFDNDFSEDIGDVLFGQMKKQDGFDFSSPDNTSDGCLRKRWKILNGKRCLIKGGSNLERQQPFNEVIASDLMDCLSIPHVSYTLIWDKGEPYSVCEDFVTSETELVSAWRIMQTQKKSNSTSVYRHFLDCCDALGAPDPVPALDRMLVLDYLIANEDRHLNNFGLIRNAETLKWLGFAPIFDSGSSLGYDARTSQILRQTDIPCKPFKKSHAEQIRLVSDFSWIDFDRLSEMPERIMRILGDDRTREFIDEARADAIAESVRRRIGMLETIAEDAVLSDDTTEDDVEENIAADYTQHMGM